MTENKQQGSSPAEVRDSALDSVQGGASDGAGTAIVPPPSEDRAPSSKKMMGGPKIGEG